MNDLKAYYHETLTQKSKSLVLGYVKIKISFKNSKKNQQIKKNN